MISMENRGDDCLQEMRIEGDAQIHKQIKSFKTAYNIS